MVYPFKNAKFIKSIVSMKDKPSSLKEVVIVGKSNVGKSSLINALLNNNHLAYTSSKPGHTRLLNYYLIDNGFYFVDCPGYGYSAKKDVDYAFYGEMVENYFKDNKYLKLVIFLLDSRHIPSSDDIDFYNYLKSMNYPFIILFTKGDKLNMSMRSKIPNNFKTAFKEEYSKEKAIVVSIKNKKSLGDTKEIINRYLSED